MWPPLMEDNPHLRTYQQEFTHIFSRYSRTALMASELSQQMRSMLPEPYLPFYDAPLQPKEIALQQQSSSSPASFYIYRYSNGQSKLVALGVVVLELSDIIIYTHMNGKPDVHTETLDSGIETIEDWLDKSRQEGGIVDKSMDYRSLYEIYRQRGSCVNARPRYARDKTLEEFERIVGILSAEVFTIYHLNIYLVTQFQADWRYMIEDIECLLMPQLTYIGDDIKMTLLYYEEYARGTAKTRNNALEIIRSAILALP